MFTLLGYYYLVETVRAMTLCHYSTESATTYLSNVSVSRDSRDTTKILKRGTIYTKDSAFTFHLC